MPVAAAVEVLRELGSDVRRVRIPLLRFAQQVNATLVAADADGPTLGMTVAARHFDEATLFLAAHAYERATPWHACWANA